MSSVVIAGNTSGSVTLAAPDVAGTTTLTLPATSGTVITSASSQIASPSFSAYPSTTQTFSNATSTKVNFDTEEWDTNNNFSSSRFTPNVAGYYVVSVGVTGTTGNYETALVIRKNGTLYKVLSDVNVFVFGLYNTAQVYLNGSTDYIEIYFYQASGGNWTTASGSAFTYFQASMVRAA